MRRLLGLQRGPVTVKYLCLVSILLVGCSAHGKVLERYDEYEERTQLVLTTPMQAGVILALGGWRPHLDEPARMRLMARSAVPFWIGCERAYLWLDGESRKMSNVVHSSGETPDSRGPWMATRNTETFTFDVHPDDLRGLVETGEARVVACGDEYWFSTRNTRHLILFYKAMWQTPQ